MLIRNTKDVSVNDIQGYFAKGADVHPRLYAAFLDQLVELEKSRQLCLTPKTRMEIYSKRVSASIERILAA